jgi:uncharacterized membrane protein
VANDHPAAEEPRLRHGPGRKVVYPLARAGNLEYDRVLFFSDAVFAIAITLLVVDLRVPTAVEHVMALHELDEAGSSIIGFAISFAVIGVFWVGHHSLFRYIKAFDRRLILINLGFLGFIAFLPYPTQLLSATETGQTAAAVFYAVCAGAAGLAEAAVWAYGTWPRLRLGPPISAGLRRYLLLRTLRLPVIFGLSIPVAFFKPTAATYVWTLVSVSGIIIDRTAPFAPAGEPDPDPDPESKPAGEEA